VSLRGRQWLSGRRETQLSYLLELALVGILAVGIDRGDPGVIVNAGVALAITQVPALLERDYQIAMSPGLVLWLTAAVFLHAFGTLGPYRNVWWWDHVTHALSASLVAAAGYAFVRAVDEHAPDVSFPPPFIFVFILAVTVAFGVAWEVLEFAIGEFSDSFGTGHILTQYGIGDTMLDLVFDVCGALLTATFGTANLSSIVGDLDGLIPGSREE
jgi:hypothetical protein